MNLEKLKRNRTLVVTYIFKNSGSEKNRFPRLSCYDF